MRGEGVRDRRENTKWIPRSYWKRGLAFTGGRETPLSETERKATKMNVHEDSFGEKQAGMAEGPDKPQLCPVVSVFLFK